MRLIRARGALRLYVRDQVHRRGRYVVTHADGRVLEEFRKQKPATQWMKDQPETSASKDSRKDDVPKALQAHNDRTELRLPDSAATTTPKYND